ncbi:cytochrome C oxidase subunit IV family protein [Tundrisphaera sp. TA3]|uniref:cytochrome C oxidase subunit IV family protein n=1 Tax=Tundrisphaera sp. TA3 TaxID=3435775 RepID=UPI003EB9CA5F
MTAHSTTYHSHKPLYFKIFAALMVLLVLTVIAAYIPFPGYLNILVAMTIAIIKAMMIVLFFMHVRDSDKVTWVFASSALIWMIILFALTLTDYRSRDWFSMPGK